MEWILLIVVVVLLVVVLLLVYYFRKRIEEIQEAYERKLKDVLAQYDYLIITDFNNCLLLSSVCVSNKKILAYLEHPSRIKKYVELDVRRDIQYSIGDYILPLRGIKIGNKEVTIGLLIGTFNLENKTLQPAIDRNTVPMIASGFSRIIHILAERNIQNLSGLVDTVSNLLNLISFLRQGLSQSLPKLIQVVGGLCALDNRYLQVFVTGWRAIKGRQISTEEVLQKIDECIREMMNEMREEVAREILKELEETEKGKK